MLNPRTIPSAAKAVGKPVSIVRQSNLKGQHLRNFWQPKILLSAIVAVLALVSTAPRSAQAYETTVFETRTSPEALHWLALTEPQTIHARRDARRLLAPYLDAQNIFFLADGWTTFETAEETGFEDFSLAEVLLKIFEIHKPSRYVSIYKNSLDIPKDLHRLSVQHPEVSADIHYYSSDHVHLRRSFLPGSMDTVVMRKGLCVCHGNGISCGGLNYSHPRKIFEFFDRVLELLNTRNSRAIAAFSGFLTQVGRELEPACCPTCANKIQALRVLQGTLLRLEARFPGLYFEIIYVPREKTEEQMAESDAPLPPIFHGIRVRVRPTQSAGS